MSKISICTDILNERARQDEKWGEQDHENLAWLAVLAEEVGEVSTETLHDRFGYPFKISDLRADLVQVAAVAVAWIESIDRTNPSLPNT